MRKEPTGEATVGEGANCLDSKISGWFLKRYVHVVQFIHISDQQNKSFIHNV